jgi:hypothetical protein
MALVEVARFLDLEEAHVAASALRSGGMPVFLANHVLGSADINLLYAMGGVRLLTLEADADDAHAFLAERRRSPGRLAALPTGEASVRVGLSLLATLLFGVVTPFRRKHRRWLSGADGAGSEG